MDHPALELFTQGVSPAVIVIRLVLAALLGGVFGWEREARDKPAGLRTHMLVAIGSATLTLLGFETGVHLSPRFSEGIDPTRIVQGIVGGLGFLGAGSIIRARESDDVSGITTAATVWFTGALGVACGVGAILVALVASALGLVVLTALRHVPFQRGAAGRTSPRPRPRVRRRMRPPPS